MLPNRQTFPHPNHYLVLESLWLRKCSHSTFLDSLPPLCAARGMPLSIPHGPQPQSRAPPLSRCFERPLVHVSRCVKEKLISSQPYWSHSGGGVRFVSIICVLCGLMSPSRLTVAPPQSPIWCAFISRVATFWKLSMETFTREFSNIKNSQKT